MTDSNIKQLDPLTCTADDVPDEHNSFEKRGRRFVHLDGEAYDHIHDVYATAIWGYLRNKPDTWIPNKHQIMKCFGIGERKYKDTIALLVRCGLAINERSKGELGRFTSCKLVILDGENFKPQCTTDNCYRCSTVSKNCTVDTGLEKSNTYHHSAENPHCGETTRMDNAYILTNKDILNNKTTTTTDQLEKNNHPMKGDMSTVHSSSRFVFDLSCLKKYGFKESHIEQLIEMKIPHLAIQESINNYANQLSNDWISARIQNKVSYFMGTMRRCKFYSLPMSQKESDEKYDNMIERQEEMRRSNELASQERDREYGISFYDLPKKLNEVPKNIKEILAPHLKGLDPNHMLGLTPCV